MGLFRRRPSEQAAGTVAIAPSDASRNALRAGVPGRCPRCDGFGYIDHIDMVNRFQLQHCPDCGHAWDFRFDEHGDAVIDLTDSAEQRFHSAAG